MDDPGYARDVAEELYDWWASEGLSNEEMVHAVMGWKVRAASKLVTLDILAGAWRNLRSVVDGLDVVGVATGVEDTPDHAQSDAGKPLLGVVDRDGNVVVRVDRPAVGVVAKNRVD